MADNAEEVLTKDEPLRPFGWRDKWGYMSGDIANNMTFMLASNFLIVFYTEVLGVPGAVAGTLFFVSRLVDAFTDVGMGRIVDRTPSTKEGKFKPWIRRIAGPVALASFLMYQSGMAGASDTVKVVYMYVTYILWGSIFYTAINIPYGSMASAISPNPDDRTQISVFRGMAGTIASMFVGTVTPLIIFTTDAGGNEVVRTDGTFTWVAGGFAILAVIFYYICYKWTTERVPIDDRGEDDKVSLGQSLKNVIKNRSLLAITFASIFLLLAMLMIPSMNNYIYPNYYNSSEGVALVNFIQPLASLVVVFPLAARLSTNYGKKEVSSIALFIGAAFYFVLFLLRPDNMYVFMTLSILGYMSMNMFNATVWGSITDVIDDHEIQTGQREDGTVYAVNSFARKIGQSLAGGLSGWALTFIGYNQLAAQQTPEVLEGLFNVTVIVPGLGLFLGGLVLAFWYPLTRKKTLENQKILAEKHSKK